MANSEGYGTNQDKTPQVLKASVLEVFPNNTKGSKASLVGAGAIMGESFKVNTQENNNSGSSLLPQSKSKTFIENEQSRNYVNDAKILR